jgi:hypothetical protein
MGKVGKILSAEQKQTALNNGLKLVTVYDRLNRGWDIERAIVEPPKRKYVPKRELTGEIKSEGKGKIRSFRVPIELDEEVDRLIEESGLSASEWAGKAIAEYLQSRKESTAPRARRASPSKK